MQLDRSPFAIATPLRHLPGVGAPLNSLINMAAGRALALGPLQRVYAQLGHCSDAAEFADCALKLLGVSVQLDADALSRIPATGGAVVIANHPYGGIEGLLWIHLLLQRRPDVGVLANHLLWRLPELRDVLIPVDVLNPARRNANVRGLRAAIDHVRQGGLLALFPAGAVSHWHARGGHVVDPAWHPAAVRLIRKCQAPVTPMFFHGHNGLGFQLAGLIHPLLRTAMLPRAVANPSVKQVQVSIGRSIAVDEIDARKDDRALGSLMRLRTYALARERHPSSPPDVAARPAPVIPLIEAIPPTLIAAELDALPAHQRLLDTNGLQVVYGQARQLPWTLQEIGRVRELTFRAVGEGTGRALDVDLFDNYYTHLICWNPATREIVGGYRLGDAHAILEHYGLRGLYTHTLFKYRHELIERLGSSLELGRSFVRPEYQRSFTPLLALWKGIATYVARHPHYRVLFGPVSISNDYSPASRLLLVEFLKRHCLDDELANLIKPRHAVKRRHPLKGLSTELAQLPDLDMLSALVADIEPDQKGMPVLLRQYLKLGGKLLGFNVDSQFSDAIDGLIVVDLASTELKTLQKYMGREEAMAYLVQHARMQDTISAASNSHSSISWLHTFVASYI